MNRAKRILLRSAKLSANMRRFFFPGSFNPKMFAAGLARFLRSGASRATSRKLVTVFLLVTVTQLLYGLHFYSAKNSSNVVVDDDDEFRDSPNSTYECRRKFAENYENWCTHSLRPMPANYKTYDLNSASLLTDTKGRSIKSSILPSALSTSSMELCPCVHRHASDSSNSNPVDYNETVAWDKLLRLYKVDTKRDRAVMTSAGRWYPTWCIPRHRIALLVPYRQRNDHLSVFLNIMHPFLRRQLVDYTIYIIEQVEPNVFNRAALLNVGYLEAKSRVAKTGGHYDCYIFHDVDLYPEDWYNFYVCSPDPRHMAAYRQGWNYELMYPLFFGGVTSLRGDHFERLNGFPNHYYGWGGEDDELWYRCSAKKVKLARRFPKCVSKYAEMAHKRDDGNPTFFGKDLGILYRPDDYDKEGLNTINYTVSSFREMSLYTNISVRLPPGPPLELYVYNESPTPFALRRSLLWTASVNLGLFIVTRTHSRC